MLGELIYRRSQVARHVLRKTSSRTSILGNRSMADVKGHKRTAMSGILTPLVFNFIWISFSVLAIIQAVVWAAVAGKTASSFDRYADRAFVRLKQASDLWSSGLPVPTEYVSDMLAASDRIKKLFVGLSRSVDGWGISWMIVGVSVLVVSVTSHLFLASMILPGIAPIWRVQQKI